MTRSEVQILDRPPFNKTTPTNSVKQIFRAVDDRVAFCCEDLQLALSEAELDQSLLALGFGLEVLDICNIARSRIGLSEYSRGALPNLAPGVVDCSSFVKWTYGQLGVWLPRYSVDQLEFAASVGFSERKIGDLVFTDGYRNYYWDDPIDGVGHVGICLGDTVVHAASKKLGVVESDITNFIKDKKVVKYGRVVNDLSKLKTLTIPKNKSIETSQEIRWKLLQVCGNST